MVLGFFAVTSSPGFATASTVSSLWVHCTVQHLQAVWGPHCRRPREDWHLTRSTSSSGPARSREGRYWVGTLLRTLRWTRKTRKWGLCPRKTRKWGLRSRKTREWRLRPRKHRELGNERRSLKIQKSKCEAPHGIINWENKSSNSYPSSPFSFHIPDIPF